MATKMSKDGPDPVPEQDGSVINWPPGSGSVIRDDGSVIPDAKKYLRIHNTGFNTEHVPKKHFVSDMKTGGCLLIADGKNLSRTHAGDIQSRWLSWVENGMECVSSTAQDN
jgi:hypothetical protein